MPRVSLRPTGSFWDARRAYNLKGDLRSALWSVIALEMVSGGIYEPALAGVGLTELKEIMEILNSVMGLVY